MLKANATLNQERALVSAFHSVKSVNDSVRELVLNAVDAIPNPKDGHIEIRVGEDFIAVFDNGSGCLDHTRFTAIRNPSDPSRFISFEGVGLKTCFQFLGRADILSRTSASGDILHIRNFHPSDDPASIYPAYEWELVKPDDLTFKDLAEQLGVFNTMVKVSKPKPEADLSLLSKMVGEEFAASHIIHVAEEPYRFLSLGGKITVVGPNGKSYDASCRDFESVEKVSFSSNEEVQLFKKTFSPIYADTPERAVRITLALTTNLPKEKRFAKIYLGDSCVCSNIEEYIRPHLENSLRHGTLARLQFRVELSQWYKDNYRLIHNKHSVKDDPILQDYLAKILKACEEEARELAKKEKKGKRVEPKKRVAKIQREAKKLLESYEGKTNATAKMCKELWACIEDLSEKVGLKAAA